MNARTTQRITADEAAWFRANWAGTSNADIAEHFHRSRAWVATTARELQLPKKNTGRRSYGTSKWGPRKHELSPAEAEWIRDNWERCSMLEITKHLHVSLPTLYDLIKPLGLPPKRRAKAARSTTVRNPITGKPWRKNSLRPRLDSVYFAPIPSTLSEKFATVGLDAATYVDALDELAKRDIWVRLNTYRLSQPGNARVFEWRVMRPDGSLSGSGDSHIYPSFGTAMNVALSRGIDIIRELKYFERFEQAYEQALES